MNIVAIQTDVHTRMSIDLSSMWNIYKVGNITETAKYIYMYELVYYDDANDKYQSFQVLTTQTILPIIVCQDRKSFT